MSLLPSWTEVAAEEREEAKSKNVCNFRRFIDSQVALHSYGTIDQVDQLPMIILDDCY